MANVWTPEGTEEESPWTFPVPPSNVPALVCDTPWVEMLAKHKGSLLQAGWAGFWVQAEWGLWRHGKPGYQSVQHYWTVNEGAPWHLRGFGHAVQVKPPGWWGLGVWVPVCWLHTGQIVLWWRTDELKCRTLTQKWLLIVTVNVGEWGFGRWTSWVNKAWGGIEPTFLQ